MARSVSTHPDSVEDIYLHGIIFDSDVDYNEDGEPEAECDYFEFDEFLDDIESVVCEKYPSFNRCSRWLNYPHGENHVILENGAAEISIAEYCGLYAISLAPKECDSYYEDNPGFVTARNAVWTGRIATNFRKHLEKRFPSFAIRRLGSFSNGEAVFAPVNRPDGVVSSKDGTLW